MAEKNEEQLSRRRFLKNSGMVAGGVVGGSLLGGLLTSQLQTKDTTDSKQENEPLQHARMFFSRKEDFDTLAAATERIFPEDDLGPGAIELGVPYFIDKQLAGSWGTNAKAYMRDPFDQNEHVYEYQHKDTRQDKAGPNTSTQAPTPTPRYQTRMNRGELFLAGIRRIQEVSEEEYGETFVALDAEQQDKILQMFEAGEVEMNAVAPVTFFNFLLQTTLEGVYSDPVYGGNKNMMGWKMKEYPGPRMGYTEEIEEEEFIVMEPKSLRDYQGGGTSNGNQTG
ncbi:MAG TPA: gluconate 2-dehydrogenase subunit 3 family protein [Bacillota bacterium]|nr:gluconate 2-dehydrogenase subunit 3 family protein [Bacillota bacterium]